MSHLGANFLLRLLLLIYCSGSFHLHYLLSVKISVGPFAYNSCTNGLNVWPYFENLCVYGSVGQC